MPDRDQSLDALRELRDVGVTPPRPDVLHARVSSAIAEEIERESQTHRRGTNGSAPGRSASEHFGAPRRPRLSARLTRTLVPAFGVLVVALVVAVFVGVHGSTPSKTAPGHREVAPSHGSVELVYVVEPTPQTPVVTRGAIERTMQTMRARLRALGVGPARVSPLSGNEIRVVMPPVRDVAQAEREVGATAQLSFYDWEANALTPNGKIVADQLQSQSPDALTISQGTSNLATGEPGAGSMGLYQAVQLASRQTARISSAVSRLGPQYWMFGAPGSAACATAARDQGTVPVAGQHCLLSGPDNSVAELESGLPVRVSAREGQVLAVQQGWVVLEAIASSFAHPVPIGDPSAQFFVLKDNVGLRGSDITDAQQSTDPGTHTPDVTVGFSTKGRSRFQGLTAAISRRGALVSGLGETLNQHFAIALDGQLITVPYVNYKTFPDGVTGAQGAELASGLTVTAARSLAAELRLGALPVNLKLVCGSVSATTPCRYQ